MSARSKSTDCDLRTVTGAHRILAAFDRLLAAVFWAVLVILFLRPSAFRLATPLGSLSVTSAKNIAVVFCGLWLALAVVRPRRYIVRTPLDLPIALLLASIAASALLSPFGPASERGAALLEAACYALFFYGASYLFRGAVRPRRVAVAFVAAAVLVAAVDLGYHAQAGLTRIVDQRYPLWDGKNALGLCMAFALALGVSLLPSPARPSAWTGAALALLLVFLCAVYSYSRAAWLALVAAAAALALLRSWRWVWLIVAAAMALAVLPSGRVARRLAATGQARDRTAAWRLVVWKSAARMVRARPLLGVGPGEFRRACAVYEEKDAALPPPAQTRAGLRYREHAHNLPLQVAAETGLAGLAALLWGAAVLARTAARGARSSPGLAAGLAAALAAFAAFSLVDCSWTGRFSGSSFLHINLLVALFAAMACEADPARVPRSAPRARDQESAPCPRS